MGNGTRTWARRGVLAGATFMAGLLTAASFAWACTFNPFSPVDPTLAAIWEKQVHCPVLHPDDPQCDSAHVTFVAHGSGTFYNGKVVDVYQDDDDTDPTPGQFLSGLSGCDGADPVRGTVTYGRQTIGNFRIGTGEGDLVATDGPGLYGICAGPPAQLSAIGQFIFM